MKDPPALRRAADDPPAEAKKGQAQEVKAAIRRGLAYLAGRQAPDGSWPLKRWTHGVSGLALLAFLGEKADEFKATTDRAVGFFRSSYVPPGKHKGTPKEEYLAGSLIGDKEGGEFLYEQAVAVLAIAEQVAANPKDEDSRRMLIEGAKLLVRTQATGARPKSLFGPVGPEQKHFGSWRYVPNAKDGDLSASGWCVVALKAADAALKGSESVRESESGSVKNQKEAGKENAPTLPRSNAPTPFAVPESVFRDFMDYCRKCFVDAANGYGYQEDIKEITNSINAVGVLTTKLCDPACELLPRAVATLRKRLQVGEEKSDYPFCYWYYATRALFPVKREEMRPEELQEEIRAWEEWEGVIRPMLLKRQGPDGSWDAAEVERDAGKEFATAVAILILQVCVGNPPPYVVTRPPTVVHAPKTYPTYTDWPFERKEAKQRQADTARALARPIEEALYLGAGTKMALVLIPAGDFVMGGNLDTLATRAWWPGEKIEDGRDDLPRHWVRISKPFYIGQTEVTRRQFARFADETGYKTDAEKAGKAHGLKDGKWDPRDGLTWRNPGLQQADDDPVVCVSWNDAMAFCDWLAKKTGKKVALPTEAQWEYACRAGSDAVWPWGDREERAQGRASVAGEDEGWNVPFRGVRDGYKLTTAPVGSFEGNAFGLKDAIGNAGEWCADRYGAKYYAESPFSDPTGPAEGQGGGPGGKPADVRKPPQDNEAIKAAIKKGLAYLAKRQAPDGSWRSPYSHGVSGLALAAFLGETPDNFKENTQRAVDFFRHSYVPPGKYPDDPKLEDSRTGSLVGEQSGSPVYEQAIAVLAMAEYARAHPEDTGARRMLTEGAKWLVRSQATAARPKSLGGPIGPTERYFGAWRYSPDATDGDLSVSGWCIVALAAARAAGFDLPGNVYRDLLVYCRKCFSEQANGYCYTPDSAANNTNTAIGALATKLCDPDSPLLPRAIATLRKKLPAWETEGSGGGYPLYYWYYATRALWAEGGTPWDEWEATIRPMLLRHQNADGSWDAAEAETSIGTDYTTALAVLILELCKGSAPEYLARLRGSDLRVARGGSWGSYPRHTTSSYRCALAPDQGRTTAGFRVSLRLDELPMAPWPPGPNPGTRREGIRGEPGGSKPAGGTPGTIEIIPHIPVLPKGVQEMFVVLTWDKNADIDLHVAEPDGQRCHYRHMTTLTGGTLDNDDQVGRGPETYRPGPQRIPGRYQIEVCYYADPESHGQPIRATVKVYSRFQGQDQKCVGHYELDLPRPDRGRLWPVVTVELPGVTPTAPAPGVTVIQGDRRPLAK